MITIGESMKIYIIGPVGSGKTTLANKLSHKYKVDYYELDKVVWDDDHNHVKRSDEEIENLFNDIISKDNWIIEDVGRKKFIEGVKQADKVYYINLKPVTIYKRVTIRWIKQLKGKEPYNYKPTIKGLFEMYKWAHNDIKNNKIENIKNNTDNYSILTLDDIKKMEK